MSLVRPKKSPMFSLVCAKTARATVWAGTVSFCMGIYHFVPYPCVSVCRMLYIYYILRFTQGLCLNKKLKLP